MPAIGVHLDDETADWLEDQRIRYDDSGERKIVSRSQVVREQLLIGRVVTDLLEESALDVPPGKPREAWVRQAALDALRNESSNG